MNLFIIFLFFFAKQESVDLKSCKCNMADKQ